MRTNFQSLSLFRIFLALYLIYDLFAIILPWYSDFYTDSGMLPRANLLKHYPNFYPPTILLLSDQPLFHSAVLAVYLLSLFSFLIGYRTRTATCFLVIIYVSLYWRNTLITSGAEMLIRALLVWSLFLPLSRYWSFDAALDPQDPDRPYPRLLLLSIRIQIGMMYILSACYKIAGTSWLDGSAIGKALQDNMFGGTLGGLWLAAHATPVLPFMTWGVVVFQFVFTPLVYCPWYNHLTRGFALLGAATMHISFIFLLNIGAFPFLCLTYLVVLIPDTWWSRWLRRRRARLAQVRIFYDPGCAFCHKVALIFRTFCLVHHSPVLPADADPAVLAMLESSKSWVIYTSDGRQLLHWRAVAYLLRQSPVFAPLGWLTDLKPLHPAMHRLYGWIGNHRPELGRLSAVFLPFRAQRAPGYPMQIACAALLVIVLAYSLFVVPRPAFKNTYIQAAAKHLPVKAPQWLLVAADWTGIEQRWDLFAPDPSHNVQRFVITGLQADNTRVDLLTRWSPAPFWLAANGYRLVFPSHRVLKYFSRLTPILRNNPEMFTNYLCRKINNNSTPETHIVSGSILYYTHPSTVLSSSDIPTLKKGFSCLNF